LDGIQPLFASDPHPLQKLHYDKGAYRERNPASNAFSTKLKQSRRMATRYDKLAKTLLRRTPSRRRFLITRIREHDLERSSQILWPFSNAEAQRKMRELRRGNRCSLLLRHSHSRCVAW